MNLNTDEILKQLKIEEFPEDVSRIYELLVAHKERIRFVKETDGINNLLVLSTKAALELISPNEIPHFSIFLIRDKTKNAIKQVHHYTLSEIEQNVEQFLTKTQHTLFIQIFFEGSILSNDDYFKLYYLLEEKNYTINEGYSRIQKLPDFYDKNASTAEEVKLETKVIYTMTSQELKFLNSLKLEVIGEIESEISFQDEEWLRIKVSEVQSITEQILELENYLSMFTKAS